MFQGVRSLSKLNFAQPKMSFVGGQETDRPSVRTHFLPLDHQKTRFARGRERFLSSGRIAQFFLFLPFIQLQMRIGRFRESSVPNGPLSLRVIFCQPG
jgi:hypothetical protein